MAHGNPSVGRQVNVGSADALDALALAVATFECASKEGIESFCRRCHHRRRVLEDAVHELEQETLELEAQIQDVNADEPDPDLQGRRAENIRRLDRFRDSMSALEQAELIMDAAMARFATLADSALPRARRELGERVSALHAYREVVLAPSACMSARAAASSGRAPLPSGFRWVLLSEVDMTEVNRIRPDKDFLKGVSYEDMRRGLQRFKAEVLPCLEAGVDGALERIQRKDGAAHGSGTGLEHLYRVFFGDEHIRLERFKGDKLFSVTNGRHRIRVARDSGWDAVPAQAVDVERGVR
ncbi:MAG: hypothetical protein U0625_12745 [Phycisphaerales bacterium]